MDNEKFNNSYIITNEQMMLNFGNKVSKILKEGDILYLNGELGTGKTTLTKGILQGFGFQGIVKSPTYTLIESYSIKNGITFQHFDFYRITHPEDLEWIGIRDFFCQKKSISVIEWPQNGKNLLPSPTKEINIEYMKNERILSLRNGYF